MNILESALIDQNTRLWQQPNAGLSRPNGLVSRVQSEELLRIMGPCSLESVEQIETMLRVLGNQVDAVRAPGKKPRTRPVSPNGELLFEGIGLSQTAVILDELLATHPQLMFASETMSGTDLLTLHSRLGLAWIGSRTQQQETCRDIGESANTAQIPVMIKNPLSPDLELFLGMIENTILGSKNAIPLLLCLRGRAPVTTSERHEWRYVPNLEWLPILTEAFPQLPVLIDPSHMLLKPDLTPENVADLIEQAVDAGAKGYVVELNTPQHPSQTDPGTDAEKTLNVLTQRKLI